MKINKCQKCDKDVLHGELVQFIYCMEHSREAWNTLLPQFADTKPVVVSVADKRKEQWYTIYDATPGEQSERVVKASQETNVSVRTGWEYLKAKVGK